MDLAWFTLTLTHKSTGADVQYPLSMARQTYNLIPESTSKTFEVVDGAPHLFCWTHPETVNKLFADFMHNQALA